MKRFGLPLLVSMALMLAAVAADAASPAHDWSKRLGGTSSDIGRAVTVDVSGNVLISGVFFGTVDFGGGPLTANSYDIFLAKYDVSGNHVWSKKFGGASLDNGIKIATDASGNVFLTGFFQGTADFGGGGLVSAGSTDAFLAKFNSAGTHQWSQRFGSTSSDMGLSVAVDGSGNVLLTGEFSNTVSFGGASLVSNGGTDIFLAKFDTNGTHQWSKRFGGVSDDAGMSVAKDATGNVFVSGLFLNAADFGGGSVNSAGGEDIFLAKYASNGNYIWSKRFGSIGDDEGIAIAVNTAGAVYMTGMFQSTVDFGGGPLVSAGGWDTFLARYDANGVHQWSKRFGGAAGLEAGNALALDGTGQPIITGDYAAGADFGSGPFPSSGSDEIFVAKYTANGAPLWSGHFGSTVDDIGYGVAVDGSNNTYFTGYFSNSVDFGGGALTSAGAGDIFLAKYSGSAAQPAITSIQDIKNDQGRKVKIRFNRSGFDDALASVPVTSYEAYRRDDAAPALASAGDPAAMSTRELAANGWSFVGSAPAHNEATYGFDVPTIGDSTITLGQYNSVFYVRASTDLPRLFYDSKPDSGYSVDNLAPGVPSSFVFTAGQLTWNQSTAKDFDYFTVYGSEKDLFGAATVVDYSVSPTMKVAGSPYVYYYVTATDFSGNESKPAKVNSLSGVGGTPKSYVLSVYNYPNPFNPRTTVSYTVPSHGAVSVAIYDANGARVATLVDHAERNAGAYTAEWDGRSASGAVAASGVYFARIEHSSGTRTKKMVLLK